MRELRWLWVALLVSGPAFAQSGEAAENPTGATDESGWFTEDGPEEAAAAPSAGSPASTPPPVTAVTPGASATTPRLILPPGQQAVVEPRCGQRAGAPIVIGCASGGAAPELDDPVKPRERPRKWYGWQTLIADLSLMGMLLMSIDESEDPDSVATVYLGGTALAAPVIHLANGQPGKAGISLAIRGGGMFLLGAMLSDSSTDWEQDENTTILAALTLLLVHPAATALDAAVFARKPVPEAQQARRGPRLVGIGPTLVRSDRESRSSRLLPGAFVSASF